MLGHWKTLPTVGGSQLVLIAVRSSSRHPNELHLRTPQPNLHQRAEAKQVTMQMDTFLEGV